MNETDPAARGVRADGRLPDEMRPLSLVRDFTKMADGSTLVSFGDTTVLCTASVDDTVPRWLKGSGRGWVSAEYSMLPGSSPERVRRPRNGPGGRSSEIQRLIGRSLRAVIDLTALGEMSVNVDCDVLQADGGTRTAAISGAYVALHDALERMRAAGRIAANPLRTECAAVSVGIVGGTALLDLPYAEDVTADVDFNVVMTGAGELVEVQGTAEGATFSRPELDRLLDLAAAGISRIVDAQRELLASPPEPRPAAG